MRTEAAARPEPPLRRPMGDDLVVLEAANPHVEVRVPPNIDPTQRAGRVHVDGLPVDPDAVMRGAHVVAVALGRTLAAAQATGGAHACVEMAVEYAKFR